MTDYLYYKDSSFALYQGKMEEVLQTLPPNSVDCIITDSPYHLKVFQNVMVNLQRQNVNIIMTVFS